MAVKPCAEIASDSAGKDYVINVGDVNEDDYPYLQSVWPMLTGTRLQWISDLDPAPTYSGPVWRGWTLEDDGWHPPVEDLSAEEDAS